MEFGFPFPRRVQLLEQLSRTPSQRNYDLRFLGSLHSFPVHSVPIELSKYRLNNGRTLAAQAEYLALNPTVPRDFFTTDFERQDVQAAQHDLLKDMLEDKELLQYFREHEQEEPLILSHQGFVVNGNRRLCAMRELYEENSHTFEHFAHVSVVILPPAEEKDIDALEAQLQIHKDIKADYSWTAEAFMLKTRRDRYQYTEKQLADLYEMTEDEVGERLQILEFADNYLQSREQPGQYHAVKGTKYAFQQLRKFRVRFKTEAPKVVLDAISFCLIDDPAGGRLYELIPAAARHIEHIADTLRSDFPTRVAAPPRNRDPLLGLTDEPILDVLPIVQDPTIREDVRDRVVDVIQSELAKERERKRNDFVFVQVRRASSALLDALNGITDTTSKDGIDSQLTEIARSIERLKEWLRG